MLEKRSSLAAIYRPGTYGADQTDPGVTVKEVAMEAFIQVAAWPETIDAVKKKLVNILGLGKAIQPGLATGKKEWAP